MHRPAPDAPRNPVIAAYDDTSASVRSEVTPYERSGANENGVNILPAATLDSTVSATSTLPDGSVNPGARGGGGGSTVAGTASFVGDSSRCAWRCVVVRECGGGSSGSAGSTVSDFGVISSSPRGAG